MQTKQQKRQKALIAEKERLEFWNLKKEEYAKIKYTVEEERAKTKIKIHQETIEHLEKKIGY